MGSEAVECTQYPPCSRGVQRAVESGQDAIDGLTEQPGNLLSLNPFIP